MKGAHSSQSNPTCLSMGWVMAWILLSIAGGVPLAALLCHIQLPGLHRPLVRPRCHAIALLPLTAALLCRTATLRLLRMPAAVHTVILPTAHLSPGVSLLHLQCLWSIHSWALALGTLCPYATSTVLWPHRTSHPRGKTGATLGSTMFGHSTLDCWVARTLYLVLLSRCFLLRAFFNTCIS